MAGEERVRVIEWKDPIQAAANGLELSGLERMLEWEFDRVVVGHGEVVESGGRQALADALNWLE